MSDKFEKLIMQSLNELSDEDLLSVFENKFELRIRSQWDSSEDMGDYLKKDAEADIYYDEILRRMSSGLKWLPISERIFDEFILVKGLDLDDQIVQAVALLPSGTALEADPGCWHLNCASVAVVNLTLSDLGWVKITNFMPLPLPPTESKDAK